jgi:hypothetical protein
MKSGFDSIASLYRRTCFSEKGSMRVARAKGGTAKGDGILTALRQQLQDDGWRRCVYSIEVSYSTPVTPMMRPRNLYEPLR